MKKKSYGTVVISMLLIGAVVGWMTFNSGTEPQPAVEYRAVCRNLPANAHWTDGSTRKEIPQTEISPNVWIPSPIGTYGTSTDATECHFVCDGGYAYSGGIESCVKAGIPCGGTIAITGTNYVLADCNVGATEVYDGTNCTSSSCPQSVAGYIFQRGNNYGFPAAGNGSSAAQAGITTGSSQIAWTGSHSTWITPNPRYNNGDTTSLRGNSNSTQGGRHVPTTTERQNIFNVLGTSQSDYSIAKTLKLPPAGDRNSSSAFALNVGAYGSYRSSNPPSHVAYACYMHFYSSYVSPQSSPTYRSTGFSVRCLKNS